VKFGYQETAHRLNPGGNTEQVGGRGKPHQGPNQLLLVPDITPQYLAFPDGRIQNDCFSEQPETIKTLSDNLRFRGIFRIKQGFRFLYQGRFIVR
jgi:hypothetical protein